MKGNVYTQQKCGICGGRMVHDENRQGCFCPEHPEARATKRFFIKFGRDINKRFPAYEPAIRYLTGLRFETDTGSYDVRDHLYSNPLGFDTLAMKYLKFKERQNLSSFYHIRRYMTRAAKHFKGTNVKHIKKRNLRDFLDGLTKPGWDARGRKIKVPLSDKSKANYCTQLHDFYHNYLYEEEELLTRDQLPKFPKVEYELGFRKLVDLETREKIVDRIRAATYGHNPKIWLGIDMLCSYGKIRPIDLRRLKEGDIDLEYGFAVFWRPSKSKKRKRPKVVSIKLLEYHVEQFKELKRNYPATDEVLFFRKTDNNQPFGKDYLYRQWKKACAELGIDDLDLYGGTRHSSTTAIGKVLGKKRARDYSGHDTNEAFDRYCQIGEQDDFEISQLMAKMRGKVIKFDQKKGVKK